VIKDEAKEAKEERNEIRFEQKKVKFFQHKRNLLWQRKLKICNNDIIDFY
jgi:hypothetical protein